MKFLKRLVRRLKRSTSWFIFAWKNEDYDYYFLYDVISRKLKDMICYFEKNKRHTNTGRSIKLMQICVKLIEHCTAQSKWSNCEELHDLLHKKYGEPKFNFIPVDKGNSKLEITYVNTPEEKQDYIVSLSARISKISNNRVQKAKAKLFYVLSKYIEFFWE